MFKNILVPTDGSELAFKAAAIAIDYAQKAGSRIVTLCVAEPYPYRSFSEGASLPNPVDFDNAALAAAKTYANRVADVAKKAGIECEAVAQQNIDPAHQIVQTAADLGCDAIFIASHGRRGLDRLMLGSVTQRVLGESTLPVLVLK